MSDRRITHRASAKAKYEINKRLETVVTRCEGAEAGFCRYADGWNDRRVAEVVAAEIQEGVPVGTVSYQRSEIFGRLAEPVPPRPPVTISGDEMAVIRENMAMIPDLVSRIARLEEDLGVRPLSETARANGVATGKLL